MDTWILTAISVAASTALTTLVGLIIKNIVSRKMDEQKELFELRTKQERADRNKDVEAIVTAGLTPINEKLDKLSTSTSNNTIGTVTLLRESLKQGRDHLIDKGFATASEVASWHELYNTYEQLGGNHFKEYVDAWKADVDSLPRETKK